MLCPLSSAAIAGSRFSSMRNRHADEDCRRSRLPRHPFDHSLISGGWIDIRRPVPRDPFTEFLAGARTRLTMSCHLFGVGVVVRQCVVHVGHLNSKRLGELLGRHIAGSVPKSIVHVEHRYSPTANPRLAIEQFVRDDPWMFRVRHGRAPIGRHYISLYRERSYTYPHRAVGTSTVAGQSVVHYRFPGPKPSRDAIRPNDPASVHTVYGRSVVATESPVRSPDPSRWAFVPLSSRDRTVLLR